MFNDAMRDSTHISAWPLGGAEMSFKMTTGQKKGLLGDERRVCLKVCGLINLILHAIIKILNLLSFKQSHW